MCAVGFLLCEIVAFVVYGINALVVYDAAIACLKRLSVPVLYFVRVIRGDHAVASLVRRPQMWTHGRQHNTAALTKQHCQRNDDHR
jgi:hypothetical protein